VVCAGVVLPIVLTRSRSSETTLPTAVVTRGDIVKTVLVDGNLEMPNKAYLSFGVTGTVTEVLVARGQNVTKGQILARLDAPSLNSSVRAAELQVKIAREQVNAAQAQYEVALINWRAAAANTTLKKVYEQQVSQAEANLEAAKLSLKVAELNLQTAKLNLEKATIVAPFGGVVIDIAISKGKEITTAALATPAASIVDPSTIEMRGFVDEIDVALVRIGQEANILLDALPDREIKGNVTFVSLVGTVRAGIVSYATTITLAGTSEGLRDGMTATAEVIIERRDNVLVIPNRAIRGSLDNPKVWVLVNGKTEEREIALGLSDGRNTEVVLGLDEGETIVLPTTKTQTGGFFTDMD